MSKSSSIPRLSRREALAYASAFPAAFLASQGLLAAEQAVAQPAAPQPPARPRPMKSSINLWALPYPRRMSLADCLAVCKDAGFDAVELNYALDGDLSPDAPDKQIAEAGDLARRMGLEVSGVCSFLFWPYALTHEDRAKRDRGLQLARQMVRAAKLLGTENVLVVPGAVSIPWMPEVPPVPPDVCERRATDAIKTLIEDAEQSGVYLNMENIFINGFLHSPQEMNAFVDQFGSDRVAVHFDTGNIMQLHQPEHWIPILGKRIRNVHLKEFNQSVHEFNIHTFRPLLDGSTNWPAVMRAFDAIDYRGYLTFEYFNPYPHYPEMLVYQMGPVLDLLLGRKAAPAPNSE